MDKFSFLIAFKKGIRAVLEMLAAVLISVLPQFLDILIAAVDDAHEVEALGLPVAWIPGWLIVVRMFTNWWKNRNLGKPTGRF